MKHMHTFLMLMAAGLMAFSACDKWTETEPVKVVYETLESKKSEHFSSELKSWVEALNPVYTIENFDLSTK